MHKRQQLFFSLALAPVIGFSPLAQAQDEGQGDKWYAGAGFGLSRLEPDRNGTIYRVDDKSSSGYKLYVGYDWSEKIAIEGYFSDLGEAKMSPEGEVSYKDLGASGLYYVYQQQGEQHKGLEAFVKVGLGWMKNDSELKYERVHNSHVMLGLGAAYRLDNGLSVRADLDLYDKDSQFFILSISKRFNSGSGE
jgi:OOP family OmpA-OmpF porin